MQSLNLCTLGYHDLRGTRHWVIRQGMEQAGYRVTECHTDARGFLPKYWALLRQYRRQHAQVDVLFVPFPGHYIMPLAWFMNLFTGKPLVFDAFISLYDTMVCDRKLVHPWSPKAWFLALMDRLSCALATVVLVDTPQHRDFFCAAFGVAPEKILVIPVGSRTDVFTPHSLLPTPNPNPNPNPNFTLLFCGNFIPLQGIETILRAVYILQEQGANVHLRIIGKGQQFPAMRQLAQDLRLENTEFLGTKSLQEVAEVLQHVDVALGIFGTSRKASRVIPHKVYDALACGTAVITADTPAARAFLTHGKNALLTPPGDAPALAAAILQLQRDAALRKRIAAAGHALFLRSCLPEQVVAPLVQWLSAR